MTIPNPPVLSEPELIALIEQSDLLVFVIRSHQAVDTALSGLLELTLPEPHRLEVARLSLLLKADILVAMGALPDELRRSIAALNQVRNRYAHQDRASLLPSDGDLLVGCLDPEIVSRYDDLKPANPENCLRHVVFILYLRLRSLIAATRRNRATSHALSEMVHERVGPHLPAAKSPTLDAIDAEIDRRTRHLLGDDS